MASIDHEIIWFVDGEWGGMDYCGKVVVEPYIEKANKNKKKNKNKSIKDFKKYDTVYKSPKSAFTLLYPTSEYIDNLQAISNKPNATESAKIAALRKNYLTLPSPDGEYILSINRDNELFLLMPPEDVKGVVTYYHSNNKYKVKHDVYINKILSLRETYKYEQNPFYKDISGTGMTTNSKYQVAPMFFTALDYGEYWETNPTARYILDAQWIPNKSVREFVRKKITCPLNWFLQDHFPKIERIYPDRFYKYEDDNYIIYQKQTRQNGNSLYIFAKPRVVPEGTKPFNIVSLGGYGHDCNPYLHFINRGYGDNFEEKMVKECQRSLLENLCNLWNEYEFLVPNIDYKNRPELLKPMKLYKWNKIFQENDEWLEDADVCLTVENALRMMEQLVKESGVDGFYGYKTYGKLPE